MNKCLLNLIVFAFLLLGNVVSAVDVLNISAEQDTAYMPLRYNEIWGPEVNPYLKTIFHPIHVLYPQIDSSNAAYIVVVGNSSFTSDMPAIVTLRRNPDFLVIDDDPFRLTINDCMVFNDEIIDKMALIGVGYKSDSAYLFKYYPEIDTIKPEIIQFANGKDTIANGIWEPNINFLLIDDYDFDGRLELFFYLSTMREIGPRKLYCLELETMKFEWDLSVSSEVHFNTFLSCKDSINPSVIFLTINPMQGRKDENYNDRFSFVSIVDNRGELIFNKVTAVRTSSRDLIQAENHGEFYVIYECPFVDYDKVKVFDRLGLLDLLCTDTMTISKINTKGEILHSIKVPGRPRELWINTYGQDNIATLFAKDNNYVVKAYNSSLNLIAKSKPVKIGGYLGKIDIPHYNDALFFSDGIYTHDLQKLLHFPRRPGYFQPVVINSDSSVSSVVMGGSGLRSVGVIEKRSFIALATVFYHRNQNYFLMILSGLLAGLITINFYRGRTKKNLKLIKNQKQELEETHDALKKAQHKIIEQEKYKQAQDIAGGFAHEMRNALFPARSALSKLSSAEDSLLSDQGKVKRLSRFSDEAIERAINLTKLVSDYTKLEFEQKTEIVNIRKLIESIIENNKFRIENQNIRLDIEGSNLDEVFGNKEQLYIVFNNLFINALDALTENAKPVIIVNWTKVDNNLVINVSDNGIGIVDDIKDKIFNVFYSTKPDTGTGFGLSMAKRIIEMYGGTLIFESQPSKNTTFTIRLKLSTNT